MLRKREWRTNLKSKPALYEEYLENERLRKWAAKKKKQEVSIDTVESTTPIVTPIVPIVTSTPLSSFSNKQTLSRSMAKADRNLPNSPRKKVEIIQRLASKFKLRIDLKENRGRPRKDLSDEERHWLENICNRGDITYINPGRKDNVYIGKFSGERMYKPRQYLLWSLRDILNIINGNEVLELLDDEPNFVQVFGRKLTFSPLYDFIKSHKEYKFNNDIPHTSCLCEICENCAMLAKGFNNSKKKLSQLLPTNAHDLVVEFSCDSDNPDCMLDVCQFCSSENAVNIHVPPCDLECSSNSGDADSDSSTSSNFTSDITYNNWQTIDKKVSKIKVSLPFDDARELLKCSIATLNKHIHTKRRQCASYQSMKSSLTIDDIMVHVDFAESYKNDQQDAIQSAYFGNKTFSIFTASCYTRNALSKVIENDNVVVIGEASDHDRDASMTCLEKVVEKVERVHGRKYGNALAWSDGCASQFRSRYVFKLLAGSVLPDRGMSWCYNERHHGKWPMDGIGGTVKNVDFRKVKSGHVIINSPREFSETVIKFVPSVHTLFLPACDVLDEPADIQQAHTLKKPFKFTNW